MHPEKNRIRKFYFALVLFIIFAPCHGESTLFKRSSNALSSTKTTLHKLVCNHPYVTTLLVWLSLRGLTKGLVNSSYISPSYSVRGYRINVDRDIYHTALNEKCAITAALMLDYVNNRDHSMPSRCVSNLHALIRTYSESTNLEFIKKSFDWTVETIKSIPPAILN